MNRKGSIEVFSLLRTLFFIVMGWYVVKWLAGWLLAPGEPKERRDRNTSIDDYGKLTDEDAEYEDL